MRDRSCGFMQVYNERTVDPAHLHRSIRSLARVCSTLAVYDDGSTDGSIEDVTEIAADAGLELLHIVSGRNDWRNEIAHKAKLYDAAIARFDPDWFVWLDADEALSPPAVEWILALGDPKRLVGVRLREAQCWDSRTAVRTDARWGRADFLRVWSARPRRRWSLMDSGRLHRQQFPQGQDWGAVTLTMPACVVHYAFDSRSKRLEHAARYLSHGDADSHGRLQDDPDAEIQPIDPVLVDAEIERVVIEKTENKLERSGV